MIISGMYKLKKHLRCHADYKPYKCDICDKEFLLLPSLTKHKKRHKGERKHLCTVCGKRFFEQNHLTVTQSY